VFEFDDLCSTIDYPIASTFTFESASELVHLPTSLEFKPLPDCLKYSFLGPN